MKKYLIAISTLILVLSLLAFAAPKSALAIPLVPFPVSEDFEGGSIPTNWHVDGLLGNVEVLPYTDFNPDFPAGSGKGTYGALLSNGPEEDYEENGDIDDNGADDWDTSTLGFAFELSPEQVPAEVGFQWSFMSCESGSPESEYDDFFMVTLNDENILTGSVPGSHASPFPDVPHRNGVYYVVDSPGLTDGSEFGHGACPFQTFSYEIHSPGSYYLEFLVADQADGECDSGLLIDNVYVGPPLGVGGELYPVNKLSVLAPWLALALLLALGGGFVVMRRRLAREKS
jgi:hypothetical protein